VVGFVTPSQFLAKLDEGRAALEGGALVPTPASPPATTTTATTTTPPAPAAAPDQRFQPQGDDNRCPSSETESVSPTDLAAQKERLLKKLEHAKALKAAQEDEENKERELARRRDGKATQETLKTIDEMKKKKELEERRKEKLEVLRHTEEVREKIRRDRELRQRQQASEVSVSVPTTPSATTLSPIASKAPSPSSYKMATIAFRLPDGRVEKAEFEATSPLSLCREHLRNNVGLTGEFELRINLPRRVFTEEDYLRSLRDLELCPSAAIIVTQSAISANRSASAPTNTGQVTEGSGFLSSLASSFWGILGYGSSGQTQAPLNSTPPAPSSGREVRGVNGNIHGLMREDREGNDSNAYWNGNSTQQY